MWPTSVPILVFLGLSVLDLGPMYATDRQTDSQTDRRQTLDAHHRLMPPPYGAGIITSCAGGRHHARPCKLIFDLLTLKVMSESGVTWATCVPILVFLGLCWFGYDHAQVVSARRGEDSTCNILCDTCLISSMERVEVIQ